MTRLNMTPLVEKKKKKKKTEKGYWYFAERNGTVIIRNHLTCDLHFLNFK